MQISTLPTRLREDLAARHGLAARSRNVYQSGDGTRRYLLRLEDGRTVETVLMPEGERDTICISSQVGCPVDCKFCMTALLGLERSLTAGEIVGQVLSVARENQLLQDGGRLNIVMMGQGEPLLNLANVVKATRLLLDPQGVGLSPRRVTVSTAGHRAEDLRTGARAVRPKLAISLNASTEESRQELMPITRKYHLKDLMDACKAYPLRPWEKLTFEYVLLQRRQRQRRRRPPRGETAGKPELQGEPDCAQSRAGDPVSRHRGPKGRELSGDCAAVAALFCAQAAWAGYLRRLRPVEAQCGLTRP